MSRTQLFKAKKFVMIYAAVALCFMGIVMFATTAKADTEIPRYIYASYLGEAVVVEHEIDTSKLVVRAVYEDGTEVDVTNYTLSTDIVLKEGQNDISVIYMGKTTTFTVTGKRTLQLVPVYLGTAVSIGNAVDPRNIAVYATYSDGTMAQVADFQVFGSTITTPGENTVHVVYGGIAASLIVPGIVPKTVSFLYVTYTGGDVMLGQPIDKSKIYVTATYVDGSTESIINYLMSTETPTMIGNNTIIISYENKTVTFALNGIEKTIAALKAQYMGDSVEVGHEVRKTDIRVTATYTDGSTELVSDFDLPNPTIYFVGAHVKTVHYMGMTVDVYVIGVAEKETSYDNAAHFTITNGIRQAICRVALPEEYDSSLVTGTSMRNSYVSTVVTRAVRKSQFITFELEVDEEIEEELPLEMKISIPSGSDAEDCALYYTPNRKTVIAKMNTEITEEGELLVLIYKTGTYILSYEPD